MLLFLITFGRADEEDDGRNHTAEAKVLEHPRVAQTHVQGMSVYPDSIRENEDIFESREGRCKTHLVILQDITCGISCFDREDESAHRYRSPFLWFQVRRSEVAARIMCIYLFLILSVRQRQKNMSKVNSAFGSHLRGCRDVGAE